VAARRHAAVAPVGVKERRDAARAQDPRDLVEVARLVHRRDVDEDVERPHRVHARVGDADQRRAGRQHVLDVAGAAEALGDEVERALGDVDQDQPLCARLQHDAPPAAAGPDLDHRAARRDGGEEHLVDHRLLPGLRRRPLLAEARPVPLVPAAPVLGGRVVAPAPVGRAEHAARALDLEQRVLQVLAGAARRPQRELGGDVARAEAAHATAEGGEAGGGAHGPRRYATRGVGAVRPRQRLSGR
jgi:hypothetical protein